ncbi:hypothetical protein ACRAWB_09775 [Leifsonia poae]|uniref:hypothetical protein n=1 Tax=Leifsonia poae TaxID=110933 RepID=UPI003D697911
MCGVEAGCMTTNAALSRLHLRAVEPGRHANIRQIERRRSRDDELARLRTFAAVRPVRPVFSHRSAALVHGLPMLGRLPATIDHLARGDTAHEVVEKRGLLVTSVARTVAELAGRASLMDGVVAADAALSCGAFGERDPLVGRIDLLSAAERIRDPDQRRRAGDAVAFADGRAESPLESVSRVSLALIGAPPPRLQEEVSDLLGFRARLDFVWPELGVVGEADGLVKYLHPATAGGRTAHDVLAAQRKRQRLIESMGWRVIRWGWATATRPDRMRAVLEGPGIPLAPEHEGAGPALPTPLEWRLAPPLS